MAKTSVQFIKEAAKKLVDSKFEGLEDANTQEALRGVKENVGLESMEEVYLFVALFDLTCRDRISNMDDLASYFECFSLDMVEYVPALKGLEHKGLIVRRNKVEENIMKQNFAVSDGVMAAIIENKPIAISQKEVEKAEIDKYEFCKRIAEKVEDDDIVTDDLVRYVEKMEQECAIKFVSDVKFEVSGILDRILFYDICYDNMKNDGEGVSSLRDTLKDIYSSTSRRIMTQKSILEGTHPLVRLGLVEVDEEDCPDVSLTDKGKYLFYDDDFEVFCKSCKCRDIYLFIERIYDSVHGGKGMGDHSFESNGLHQTINRMEQSNKHFPEVETIKRLIPDEYSRILYYAIGYGMINDDTTSLSYEVKALYPRRDRQRVLKEFKDHNHTLQKKGLVEIVKTTSLFGEQTNIEMTDKGKEVLLGEDASLYIKEVSDQQLIHSDKIAEKRLFFSNELDEQLSLLRNSLDEDSYQRLCARLEANHLPKGIAVLFYGEPGTGKTESVMQLARATGRAIMHVDISETKTCWFGESEKLIKKVFTDYRRLCEKSKVKPILLFNEADAIFSKRKDVNSGSVAQTENAIQNIILEELETLDGILVATTNLADNLDGAFERRFLFKIRFDKPTVEAKTNIWKSKMASLSSEDAQTLAERFEFSGGQIDNIVRKALMQEVIKGEKPTLNTLVTMCGEEKISKNCTKRIGFC